jgi:hypothetical protein
MVDLRPSTLQWSGVSPNSYRDVVFKATDLTTGNPTDANTLSVYWGSADEHYDLQTAANKKFDPTLAWGSKMSVIQFSITPLTPAFTRQYLIDNTYTAYLYPQDGSDSYNVATDQNGKIINASCTGPNEAKCKATITGVPAADRYLIHFTNYYDAVNVRVNAQDHLGQPVGFSGGQVVIDSTGRARDVLKRLQVHMPLDPKAATPNDPVDGQSICKRFTTYPNSNPVPDPSISACNFWN